ncbi:MAG: NTF2 fold immunity protein [Fimbriiglobus sp.]
MPRKTKDSVPDSSPIPAATETSHLAEQPSPLSPLEMLRAFWTAMCEWEKRAWSTSQAARHVGFDPAPLLAERAMILAQFCTPKPRKQSEPFSCGVPTMYDPDIEDVLEVIEESARRVVVHTQQRAGFGERRRYVILLRDNQWRLDSWQSQSDGGNWDRGII